MPKIDENIELVYVKVYVEDEFAVNLTCIKNDKIPNTSIAEYVEEGYDQIVCWEDYHNLPTRGMIYNGETFLDGENGETFRQHLPAFDFNFETFVFIKNNIVLGYYLVTDNIPSNALIVAALKSNPTFEVLSD